MSDYQIRLYQDSDYNTVRELFAQGILEQTQTAFNHALSLSHIRISMLLFFLVPFLVFKTVILSIVSVLLAFLCLWLGVRYVYVSYVNNVLSGDMLDIKKYYLHRDGYSFWVAESAGETVGTVAVLPAIHPGGERHVELKRMSVSPNHRGKGIARALCWTLIDFARAQGSDAIILETTHAHLAAHGLYKSMGFVLKESIEAKGPLEKVVDYKVLRFQYDFPVKK